MIPVFAIMVDMNIKSMIASITSLCIALIRLDQITDSITEGPLKADAMTSPIAIASAMLR